jgi:hypothetical protein
MIGARDDSASKGFAATGRMLLELGRVCGWEIGQAS